MRSRCSAYAGSLLADHLLADSMMLSSSDSSPDLKNTRVVPVRYDPSGTSNAQNSAFMKLLRSPPPSDFHMSTAALGSTDM